MNRGVIYEARSTTRVAGAGIKPGVERSGTPGPQRDRE